MSVRHSPESENFFAQPHEEEIELAQNQAAFDELVAQAGACITGNNIEQATELFVQAQRLLPDFNNEALEANRRKLADLESRMPAI